MDLMQFSDWLDTRGYSAPMFLLRLPNNPDDAIAVQVVEGIGSKGTVTNYLVSFYVRTSHPAESLQIGTEIIKDLDMLTRVFIEDTQIILLQAMTSIPIPLGTDENDRHVVNVQFKMLVSPTDKLNVKEQ